MDEFMELLFVSGMLDENVEKFSTNNQSFDNEDIDENIEGF